jgi:FkbM family methyltransferase
MLIFDIGANEGRFAEECFRKHENCQVILVEPNPELLNGLEEKFKNKNVKIINKLVSSKSNLKIDFYVNNLSVISTASHDWINNSRFKDSNWKEAIKIESISLDDLIVSYGTPDILKVDVEGYELEVFEGLTSKQKKICFEWAEEQYDKINKTCDHLKSIGYKDFGFIDGDQYLLEATEYTSWEKSNFHLDIIPERKIRWGMIWAI